jgi:hypothetical protein
MAMGLSEAVELAVLATILVGQTAGAPIQMAYECDWPARFFGFELALHASQTMRASQLMKKKTEL